MPKLKLAGASLNQTPIDWANNIRNIRDAIAAAKADGVDILCLPEMCITGYGCEDLFLSDFVPAKAMELMLELRRDCKGISVCLGMPVRFEGNVYNTACMISDGKLLGFTVKQYLARDGVYYEPRWFRPWQATHSYKIKIEGEEYPFGDVIHEVNGIKLGIEICEDAWHEEDRPGQRLLDREVDLILNPSASHFTFGKTLRREDLITSSSLRYKCVYLYANLLGNESGRIVFDGDIMIAQKGRLLCKSKLLTFQQYNVMSCDVDFSEPDTNCSTPMHSYTKEEELRLASTLALYDYMRKSHSRGFTLSLSGGADSSCCAIMVAEMVKRGVGEMGAEEFLSRAGLKWKGDDEPTQKGIVNMLLSTVYQGTKNSSEDTFNSAKELAESIGAKFYDWTVDDLVEGYQSRVEGVIGRELNWKDDDIALQNIQARTRAPGVWMLTNINGSLLLTTSNRNEGSVGYTTMDGDTAGGLAPIAGLDKQFISHWLRYAERELGYSGLALVNGLQPSAELRPLQNTQTDEEDLMPYRVLQEIERAAIRQYGSPRQVFEQLAPNYPDRHDLLKRYIRKFFTLWSRNQWKRERIAPSFTFDDYNVDPRSWYRFPILNGGYLKELEELDSI